MSEKLRLLWASVTPSMETGYGRVTYYVVSSLIDAGIDVICYGSQTSGIRQLLTVKGHTFPMVGTESATYQVPVVDKLKRHMKENDRNCVITLWDIWSLGDNFSNDIFSWIPYIPLDSEITNENYFIARNAFKRITMSRFAQDQFNKVMLGSTYIPHGVDTNVYRPLSKEDKQAIRMQFGFPPDAFVVGTVGKNFFDRKRFDRMLQIFSIFVKRNNLKNAYLLMHTNKEQLKLVEQSEPNTGYDIRRLAELCDIADYVSLPSKTDVTDRDMLLSYNCMDVYLSTSAAEGFGLPIIEAQACGIPAIVPDNSAQPEHVEDHGWIVPCSEWDCRLTTPLHNKWWFPDIEPTVKALEDAYENRNKVEELGEKSRDFVVINYDWNHVIENYWLPFLESTEKDLFSHPIFKSLVNQVKYFNV